MAYEDLFREFCSGADATAYIGLKIARGLAAVDIQKSCKDEVDTQPTKRKRRLKQRLQYVQSRALMANTHACSGKSYSKSSAQPESDTMAIG